MNSGISAAEICNNSLKKYYSIIGGGCFLPDMTDVKKYVSDNHPVSVINAVIRAHF